MTVDDSSIQPASPLGGGLLARHPLISFFVMAYAFSWIAWSPWFLSEDGVGLLPYDPGGAASWINIVALALGPFMSAFIMTGAIEGRTGIRRFLRRFVLWRVGFQWYLVVLVGIPLMILLGTIVLPGATASFEAVAVPSVLDYLSFFVLVLVFGGPLLEEPGWRGFALPRLQRLHGPLIGSIILGILWALWHLPQFFIPSWDTPKGTVLDIVWFTVFAISSTIIFTWVFNNTRGSLLMAILAHTSINAFGTFLVGVFPAPIVTGSVINFVIGFGVAALLVVVFTRGHLGYQNYRQEEDPDPAAAPT